MKPIKICFITHSSGIRGAELALIEAIEGLLSLNVAPVVFVPNEGLLVSRLKNMGIDTVLYSSIPWVTTRRNFFRSTAKTLLVVLYTLVLAVKLRKQNCQVVYSNSIATSMGAWAASFINVPHVWHIHEFGYEDHGLVYDLGDRFARWVYRKKGGYFIVNSVAVAKKYLNFLSEDFFQKKHKVIYQSVTLPPVDPLFSRPELRCETVLVLVGALHKNKGQADAISAICKLRNQGIKAGLVLVGEGEDRGYFEQMVSELDIQRYVHFIGSVENVSNWIALSDIALVCSKLEAFGRVAVEAMLCKKPVIAANTGGLNEIVRHGETGLQYEPGDIDGLVANIILLIDDKSMYKNFSEKAYAWVTENFNKDKYGKDLYETIADEVLKK